jgi:HEPN domain-containing protein
MNRDDFQKLANLRIKESRVLLDNGCFEAAYYLAGYAVECALKACIAKQTKRYDFPPDVSEVRSIYTHDLTKLLEPAGLMAIHKAETASNINFKNNWTIIKDWSEQSRYDHSISVVKARDLYDAIVARKDGVLTWLRKYW